MTQHELREKIGYVPQKGMLFSGTIASNIAYSDEECPLRESRKQPRSPGKAIHRRETGWIRQSDLPRRRQCFRRQKQRLSIARAVAKHPDIFIFDDSFSALDFKTDGTLRKALKAHTKDATTIIVAQRISTILNADKIIVLDDGHMAGIGSHKD